MIFRIFNKVPLHNPTTSFVQQTIKHKRGNGYCIPILQIQLERRAFDAVFFRQEFEIQELLLHIDVRWLSSGKILQRFCNLLQEIKVFFKIEVTTMPS